MSSTVKWSINNLLLFLQYGVKMSNLSTTQLHVRWISSCNQQFISTSPSLQNKSQITTSTNLMMITLFYPLPMLQYRQESLNLTNFKLSCSGTERLMRSRRPKQQTSLTKLFHLNYSFCCFTESKFVKELRMSDGLFWMEEQFGQ